MSLRLPDLEALRRPRASGFDVLSAELMAERAAALGHHGNAVEKALSALRAASEADRPARLRAAAKAVWAYFVQREAIGLRDHREVIALYGIPGEVLARLGAMDGDELYQRDKYGR